MNFQNVPFALRNNFEQTPGVLGGRLRIRGTRVSVEQVLELLETGMRPDEIAGSFPSLTESDIRAVERLAIYCTLTAFQAA